jgi:hypothetical protein
MREGAGHWINYVALFDHPIDIERKYFSKRMILTLHDSELARAPGETAIEGSFLAGLNPSFKLIPGLSPTHCRVVCMILSPLECALKLDVIPDGEADPGPIPECWRMGRDEKSRSLPEWVPDIAPRFRDDGLVEMRPPPSSAGGGLPYRGRTPFSTTLSTACAVCS